MTKVWLSITTAILLTSGIAFADTPQDQQYQQQRPQQDREQHQQQRPQQDREQHQQQRPQQDREQHQQQRPQQEREQYQQQRPQQDREHYQQREQPGWGHPQQRPQHGQEPYHYGETWHHRPNHAFASHMPFHWHQNFAEYHYRQERMREYEWERRFPGLYLYHWHGAGFEYEGHYINDGVLFYNNYNELVSVGFIHNHTFVVIREDGESYDNDDQYFQTWFQNPENE